jgi:dTDP-4-amino-4,6-dideoxygalactose transaminase
MGPMMEIAAKHNLVVIEDASQAHAARYDVRRTGSLGHLGCFSFYPTKNLGALGEAGAVVTDNANYATKLRMLRDWGQEAKYKHVLRGFNHRMEALQGMALRTKLRHLADWTSARRRLARRYDKDLQGLSLCLPKQIAGREHVYHIYAVRVRDRDRVQADLASRGIATAVHYPEPVHLIAAYRDLGYGEGAFPVSETLAKETLSLPLFPEMTDDQQDRVIAALRAITL